MVHKHSATRLHYDLRLEIGGALASWAVPQGPSYDPGVKRLAVETEDHPLEYGAFEGRIPEGEYGAGDSVIWDSGTWQTVPPGQVDAMREKGHIAFELGGQKLRGRWHLIRTSGRRGQPTTGKPQWLLVKGKDEWASATFDVCAQRPESVRSGRRILRGPHMRSFVRGPHPQPIELLIKIWPPPAVPKGVRGERALAGVSAGRVALQSSAGRDLAASHPEVVKALAGIDVVEAVIDGAIDPGRRGGPARFVARDLHWLDGEDLRARPPDDRRDLLLGILSPEWLPKRGRKEADPLVALANGSGGAVRTPRRRRS